MGHKGIKIAKYADDTTLLVRDLDSVAQVLKRLNNMSAL